MKRKMMLPKTKDMCPKKSSILSGGTDYIGKVIGPSFPELLYMYEEAIESVKSKIEEISAGYSNIGCRSPIHGISCRLKSPESIKRKLSGLGEPFTVDAVRNNLNDVAGVRIISRYVSDVYLIRNLICAAEGIELIKEKDYIERPKPNGYRSLHMIVEVGVPCRYAEGIERMRCEIQIRTIAMDSWASVEHELQYKRVSKSVQLRRQLKECADIMFFSDMKMQHLAGRV